MNIITQIKRFFRVASSTGKTGSIDMVIIHEDNHGQIELSPAENLEYLMAHLEKARSFSKEHFDGYGWTEIYERKPPPYTILDRKIRSSEFSASFVESGFTKKELRFSSLPETDINQFVLVKDKVNIYCIFSGKFVSSIYFYDYEDKTLLINVLFNLSRRYDLILVDWNLEEIFDTRREIEIDRFINR